MACGAESYDLEATRVTVIKPILAKICDVGLVWGSDWFTIKPDALNDSDSPFLIVEVKNEAGMEGDASLQAALSYAHIAASPLNEVKSFYVYRHHHSFLSMWIVGYTENIELSRCSFRHHGQPS